MLLTTSEVHRKIIDKSERDGLLFSTKTDSGVIKLVLRNSGLLVLENEKPYWRTTDLNDAIEAFNYLQAYEVNRADH
jgi:hypothetical protein